MLGSAQIPSLRHGYPHGGRRDESALSTRSPGAQAHAIEKVLAKLFNDGFAAPIVTWLQSIHLLTIPQTTYETCWLAAYKMMLVCKNWPFQPHLPQYRTLKQASNPLQSPDFLPAWQVHMKKHRPEG